MDQQAHAPIISVIVPVYNAEKTLHRCVDSILAQTFTDFELLLINDGSKDHSGEICEEYAKKDSRVRVFHKENGGVSSARNVGIDNVLGQWIAFIDSDDWVEEDFLSAFNLNSSADFIIGNAININGSEVIYLSPFTCSSYAVNDFLLKYMHCSIMRVPWGKLYKKSIIRGGLYFEERLRCGEDLEFNCRYLARCKNIEVCDNTKVNTNYVFLDSPFFKKYQMSVLESVESLMKISESYAELGVCSQEFERNNVALFYELCREDMKDNYKYWYGNPKIRRLCLKRARKISLLNYIRTFVVFLPGVYQFYRLFKF